MSTVGSFCRCRISTFFSILQTNLLLFLFLFFFSKKKMSFWNNLHLEFKCHISCSPMWHLNRDCDLWHLTILRCLYEVSIFSQHLRLSASSFLDTIDAIWLRFVRLVALLRWLDWIHNFSSCDGHRWNINETNKKIGNNSKNVEFSHREFCSQLHSFLSGKKRTK